MSDTPLVSILVPVYNRECYIKETVRSALDQTYPTIEVVVVDNCSTDNTWGIVSEMARQDSRIRSFRNSENIGPVRNWIAAAARADGEYSKILWSDDLMHPRFIETAVAAFQRHNGLAFVYSSVAFINDAGTVTSKPFYSLGQRGLYAVGKFVTGTLLDDRRFPVSPGCGMFRTADLRKNIIADFPNCHNFNLANIAIGNDLLVYLLTTVGRNHFFHIADVQNYFRIHAGSISLQEGNKKLYAFYKLAKCYFAATWLSPEQQLLIPGMNAQIRYFLMRSKQTPDGFRTIRDFYPPDYNGPIGFSVFDTMKMLLREIVIRAQSPGRHT